MPWANKITKSAALLYAKLRTKSDSLAGKMLQAYDEGQAAVPFLQHGKDLLEQAQVSPDVPPSKKAKSLWKKEINRYLTQMEYDALNALVVGMTTECSDELMLRTMPAAKGAIKTWDALVPNVNDQALIHHLRLGAPKWTLTTRSRQDRGFASLPHNWRTALLRCPCHLEAQTSVHVWKRCPIARGILARDFSPSTQEFQDQLLTALQLDSNIPDAVRREKLGVLARNLRALEEALGTSFRDLKKLYAG